MKKLTLLLGVALIMGASAFACDGKKDGCCKGKKETAAACHKDKKEVAANGKGCCKKGEGKTATANDAKKAPTKEAKATAEKKS
jgi:hypothetical protein